MKRRLIVSCRARHCERRSAFGARKPRKVTAGGVTGRVIAEEKANSASRNDLEERALSDANESPNMREGLLSISGSLRAKDQVLFCYLSLKTVAISNPLLVQI